MKHASIVAINALALAGMLIGGPALAAGLPVAGFRQMPLAESITRYDAVEGAIHMTRGRIKGVVTDQKDDILTVTDTNGTDYTVETSLARYVNAVGRSLPWGSGKIGDYVVLDGYFPKNSTAMDARRVIDTGVPLEP